VLKELLQPAMVKAGEELPEIQVEHPTVILVKSQRPWTHAGL
jgi:hypothetical protein